MSGFTGSKKPTQLLGFHGYTESGKDTVADHLADRYGFQSFALADTLREILIILNPYIATADGIAIRLVDIIESEGWDSAKRNPHYMMEFRRLLQTMGTDIGRIFFGKTIWMDIARSKMVKPDVVITDIRFPDEANWLRSMGGTLINVVRPGYGRINEHSSEELVFCDYMLGNDGTLDDLKIKVDSMVVHFKS